MLIGENRTVEFLKLLSLSEIRKQTRIVCLCVCTPPKLLITTHVK